eukprot:TRINITY_DN3463_c0_g2_i1.p1 TRINITY_DN3463_c0_g2~~TRINITY_DN3463_c0_g2_i1.p1  ORF type:complete len:413 (-),score=32.21 TRINITY_DN3463_c0_g2_i1:124-1314(-)
MDVPRTQSRKQFQTARSQSQLSIPFLAAPPTSSPPVTTILPPGFVPPGQAKKEAAKGPSNPFWIGKLERFFLGEVNYVLLGPENGPLIVCVHGVNGCVSSFENLAQGLLQYGFRVLLFDLYGFGMSAKPRRPLNKETYVQQLMELIFTVAKPVAPVFLIGYSMGGVISVEFTRRYPQWVKRLLLLAPAGLLKKSETSCRGFVFGCLRQALGGCVVASAEGLSCMLAPVIRRKLTRNPDSFSPDVRDPDKFIPYAEQTAQRFTWNIPKSVGAYVGVVRNMPLWEESFETAYAELARGPVPVLFIWGDDDCTVPWWEEKDKIMKYFAPRGTSCILLEGGGHGLCLEDAAAISNYAACWFLDSRDPGWCAILGSWRLAGQAHCESLPHVHPSPPVLLSE